MSDKLLPNQNFIRYLQTFGPWANSNNQYDEYVSATAANLGVDQFEFEIPRHEAFTDTILSLVSNSTPQVVLLAGNAGDGKTHFMRKLLDQLSLDKNEVWNRLRDERVCEITVGSTQLILVKDLSDTDKNDDEMQKIITGIKDVLNYYQQLQSQQSIPTNKVLIIAGNKGKILECFNEYLRSEHEELIDKLENVMLGHENKAILKNTGICLCDLSTCIDYKTAAEVLQKVLTDPNWNKCNSDSNPCEHCEYCPIFRNRSLLLNPVVRTRFRQMYALLYFLGEHFTIRSLMIVVTNAILGRVDYNKLITNSRKAKIQSSSFFMCSTVKEQSDDLKDRKFPNNEFFASSEPFDNLFGINLLTNKGATSTIPAFMQLDILGVGTQSNKQINEILMHDYTSNDASTSNDTSVANIAKVEQLLQDSLNKDNKYKLNHDFVIESLKQLRKLVSDIKSLSVDDYDYDEDDSEEEEQDNKHESSAKKLTDLQALLPLKLASLRRTIFFNLFCKQSNAGYLFAPYMLTNLHYAEYYLHRFSNQHITEFLKHLKQLIVGMNRAFTHLMIMDCSDGDSKSKLYITTNNQFNPTAFCILSDKENMVVDVRTDKLTSEQDIETSRNDRNELNFTISSTDLVLRLQLSKSALDDPNLTNDASLKKIELVITPKLFDYLMSLANGTMAISFSSECLEELNAFKDKLSSCFSKLALANIQKDNSSTTNSASSVNDSFDVDLFSGTQDDPQSESASGEDNKYGQAKQQLANTLICKLDSSGKIN